MSQGIAKPSDTPAVAAAVTPLLPWLEAPLAQALSTQRGHALLIHGPEGVGQFELALALAAAALCEAAPDARRAAGQACGACTGCRLIASRTHPDLLVLLPEVLQQTLGWASAEEGGESSGSAGKGGTAKPSKEIKVAAVRLAVAFAQQTTSRGGPKLVVVYPAERMNPISANTLLKTLEEPPGSARFILCSAAPMRLLATVRSRCQRLALPVPDPAVARQWLQGQGVERPDVVLAAAGGQALLAMERLALGCDALTWLRLPKAVSEGEVASLATWPLPMVIDALQKICHDALCCAVGAPPRYFAPESIRQLPRDVARLTACGGRLRQAARYAEHPWHVPLGIEALVQAVQCALRPPTDTTHLREPPRAVATLKP